MDTTVIVLIAVLIVLVVALVGAVLARRRRSERLQEHFGPEYERSVSATGNRKAAEAELSERERRHRKLDIRDLRPDERTRFEESWNGVQRGFVDDPSRSLRDADQLVSEIMSTRGYPVDDFDRRAEDISVEHPEVVHHYREARTVHDSSADGTEDTERQRRAVTSYRHLVEALLGHERHADPNADAAHADHRDDSDRVDHQGRRVVQSTHTDTDTPTTDRPTEERPR
ncbi:MAG: hypothetical protein ACRDRK_15945 [Pseudonocardia sp.]